MKDTKKYIYFVFRKFLVIAEFIQPRTLLFKPRINKDYKSCHDSTGSRKLCPTLQ